MRPLGKVQEAILDSLKEHSGVWHPWCGWYWENFSTTTRVLNSLVKRGLVETYTTGHNLTGYRLKENDSDS